MLTESVAEAQPGGSYALPAADANVPHVHAMPGDRLFVHGSYRDVSNAQIIFTRLYDAAGALLWEREGRAYFNGRYGPSMASDGSVFLAFEGTGLSRITISGETLWTVPLETTLDALSQGFWLDEDAGELYYFDTDDPNRGGIEEWHLYALDTSTGATLRKVSLAEQGVKWIRRYFYSDGEFAVFEHPDGRLEEAAITYITPSGSVTSSTNVSTIADTPRGVLPAVEYGPEQRVYLQSCGIGAGRRRLPIGLLLAG